MQPRGRATNFASRGRVGILTLVRGVTPHPPPPPCSCVVGSQYVRNSQN